LGNRWISREKIMVDFIIPIGYMAVIGILFYFVIYPNLRKSSPVVQNAPKRDRPLLHSPRYGICQVMGGERFTDGTYRILLKGNDGTQYSAIFEPDELVFPDTFNAIIGQDPAIVVHQDIMKNMNKVQDKQFDQLKSRNEQLRQDKERFRTELNIERAKKFEEPERLVDEFIRLTGKTIKEREPERFIK
jgi:hypothetical protein